MIGNIRAHPATSVKERSLSSKGLACCVDDPGMDQSRLAATARPYPHRVAGHALKDERHEDRQRWVREHLDELPTLDDVQAIIDRFINDYNNRPHTAPDLFGYTPLYAMEKFRNGPARMESDAVLDFLFGEFVGPRLVRRDGIRYLNQLYGFGDSRVIALQGRRVYLCIQPDDARTVLLCDERKRPLFRSPEAIRLFAANETWSVT